MAGARGAHGCILVRFSRRELASTGIAARCSHAPAAQILNGGPAFLRLGRAVAPRSRGRAHAKNAVARWNLNPEAALKTDRAHESVGVQRYPQAKSPAQAKTRGKENATCSSGSFHNFHPTSAKPRKSRPLPSMGDFLLFLQTSPVRPTIRFYSVKCLVQNASYVPDHVPLRNIFGDKHRECSP